MDHAGFFVAQSEVTLLVTRLQAGTRGALKGEAVTRTEHPVFKRMKTDLSVVCWANLEGLEPITS